MLLPTGAQMQEVDRAAIEGMGIPSLQLMELAGAGVADAVRRHADPADGPIVIVCGKGNNAGDGLVAACLLATDGYGIQLWLAWDEDAFSGDARTNWDRLMKEAERGSGRVEVRALGGREVAPEKIAASWEGAAVVVDALLGTGAGGAPRPPVDSWITAMNLSDVPVLAVDIPSGVDADTGRVEGSAPLAATTVTMALPKLGLLLHPGRTHAGSIQVVDIGIPAAATRDRGIDTTVMTHQEAGLLLPIRGREAHKGDVGRLAVVAGSAGMMGAAQLVCAAACRSGAGLVRHAAPASLLAIAQSGRPEVMVSPVGDDGSGRLIAGDDAALEEILAWADVAAIGPGIGRHERTAAFLDRLFSLAPSDMPGVLDADGLNLMAEHRALRQRWRGPLIVTPHPGEAARLLESRAGAVLADRPAAARALAAGLEAVAVLKGAPTLIASPDGGVRLCPLGNPGMASGGAGDVLTGVIAALLGQGLPPFAAASLGVYLHALAGDLAALDLGEWSLTASDIVDYLPAAFGHLEAFPDRDVLADGVWE